MDHSHPLQSYLLGIQLPVLETHLLRHLLLELEFRPECYSPLQLKSVDALIYEWKCSYFLVCLLQLFPVLPLEELNNTPPSPLSKSPAGLKELAGQGRLIATP